ncbi:MAG: OmpH family outer membrane protein [Bacteroidetes bacterium]|nr:OmpH family outer membrane protein [Bacteroidota bacterium]
MKKLIFAAAVLLLSVSAASGQAQKIAFVNIQSIIDTLPDKDTAEKKLAAIAYSYDEQLQQLQMEIEAKQKEYEKISRETPVSQIKLELVKNKYEQLTNEYKRTEELGSQDVQMQRANLLKPILDDVKKAIAEVAKAKGYSHVVDNSAGIVLYSANTSDDITNLVISGMLAKVKTAPKAPATPGK